MPASRCFYRTNLTRSTLKSLKVNKTLPNFEKTSVVVTINTVFFSQDALLYKFISGEQLKQLHECYKNFSEAHCPSQSQLAVFKRVSIFLLMFVGQFLQNLC